MKVSTTPQVTPETCVTARHGDPHFELWTPLADLVVVEERLSELNGDIHSLWAGDVADFPDGADPKQFERVYGRLAGMNGPKSVAIGDHDPRKSFSIVSPGNPDAFNRMERLGARGLLIVVDERDPEGNHGNMKFNVGPTQLAWIAGALDLAEQEGRTPLVMGHAEFNQIGLTEKEEEALNRRYDGLIPLKLPDGYETSGQELERLLCSRGVLEYAHGHEHHGIKRVNDHGMLLSATQSIPQSFVDQPPHFMVGVHQNGSFRNGVFDPNGHSVSFVKVPLDGSGGPLGLITSPMDARLAGNPNSPQHVPSGQMHINGLVIRGRPSEVTVQIGRSREVEMQPLPGSPGLLTSPPFNADPLPPGLYTVTMRTRENGMLSAHAIQMAIGRGRWDFEVRRGATAAAGVISDALGTSWGGIGPNHGGHFENGRYVETFGPPFTPHAVREAAERDLFS